MEHFHLQLAPTPGDLTELQLQMVYFHPRDSDGVLIPPPEKVKTCEPVDLEEALEQLEILRKTFRYTNVAYLQARQKLVEKYKER